MRKILLKSLLFISVASLLWGCYPYEVSSYDELDIVYTNYKKDFVFSGHGNYAMPDSIVKITGEAISGNPLVFIAPTYGNSILSRIKSNMTSLGYTLVTDTTQADFILMPSALEYTSTSYYYYYDYYYYYYGWYYPYGYYYPYTMSTSYTTGTLMMNLLDRKNLNPNGSATVLWTSIINGLMEGSSSGFTNRVNTTIDQAFSQSQYLHQ